MYCNPHLQLISINVERLLQHGRNVYEAYSFDETLKGESDALYC